MKALVVLLGVLSVAICGPILNPYLYDGHSHNLTYLLVEKSPGLYAIEDLTKIPPYVKAEASDIAIYFYSQSASDGVVVEISDANAIAETAFSASKETVFVVHGWQNNYKSPVNVLLKEAYLSVQDMNVFVVDWSKVAMGEYVITRTHVSDIGNFLGTMVSGLVATSNLDLAKTHFVGHSLGAHVAGIAAATFNGQVEYIVDDAKFVQIIHTCPGLLGFDVSIGDADYWPNGSKDQPGCVADIVGACAHSRAYQYYAESIKSGNFVAKSCDNYNDFEAGECSSKASSYMGQYPVDKSASGDYYLETNPASPYAKGS